MTFNHHQILLGW